jgi:predicted dehydrogenase
VVATPPRDHVPVALTAFEAGVHLLLEKPIAPTVAEAGLLLRRHDELAPTRVFATALPLRADARYLELARLLAAGELGEVSRVSWTVTDCFRSDAYYRSRPWRSSADGGGGVLLNQCLHQLDLSISLFGLPRSVQARVGIGRHHSIEVEDDVTASFELDNGATSTFVASTGELPGCNRLEVAASRARVVIEEERIEITRNAAPTGAFLRGGPPRAVAACGGTERRALGSGGLSPAALLSDFIAAIRFERAPSASARSSLGSIVLAEAVLRAGSERRAIDLTSRSSVHEPTEVRTESHVAS